MNRKEKDMLKILSTIAIGVCMLLVLSACSTSYHERDHYKLLLGKKCSQDGTKFSYVWFHTVYGDDQVKKEWCNK